MKVILNPVQAEPVLRQAEPSVRHRLKAALAKLGQDPSGRRNALDVKRLAVDAAQPIYRCRVGQWRIVFTVDTAVVVLKVFHRSEGYGWLADMD